jgi:hypothetical protein
MYDVSHDNTGELNGRKVVIFRLRIDIEAYDWKLTNNKYLTVSRQELTTLLNHVPKELFHSPHTPIRRCERTTLLNMFFYRNYT